MVIKDNFPVRIFDDAFEKSWLMQATKFLDTINLKKPAQQENFRKQRKQQKLMTCTETNIAQQKLKAGNTIIEIVAKKADRLE